MKEFRLGCVGLGERGSWMLQWIADGSEGMIPVAGCDMDPDKFYKEKKYDSGTHNQALADRYPDMHYYSDFDEMLEKENLDILMVETPANCHADYCIKALARNIHVFSDIPSVASLDEADRIWKAQQESSAMLMTGATTMGWGFIHSLQELVQNGMLGKPEFMEAEYIHDCRIYWKDSPWRKPKPGVDKYPISYCTHSLGPLLSLIDEDLSTVSCCASGGLITGIPGTHDFACANYQTKSGVIIRSLNSFINNCVFAGHSFRVYGTEGSFEHFAQRDKSGEVNRFLSKKMKTFSGFTPISHSHAPLGTEDWEHDKKTIGTGHGGADAWLWHIFAEALRNGEKKAPIDLRAGLRMTLPGIYARESAKRGGELIQIRYPWDSDWDPEAIIES